MNTMLNRMTKSGLLGAIVAAVALMGAAAPALAGGSSCNSPRVVISLGRGVDFRCGTTHRPVRSWADIEYERGLEAGRCAGFDEGYGDAVGYRSFCDEVKSMPCGTSRNFQAGFQVGFRQSYCDGFDKGKRERSRCQPHRSHGSHWRR